MRVDILAGHRHLVNLRRYRYPASGSFSPPAEGKMTEKRALIRSGLLPLSSTKTNSLQK